jgi:transcriptional regulator with XRE-family HTH domain
MVVEHPLSKFIPNGIAALALARRVGTTVSHLRNIRDKRRSPSLGLAKKLSDATGIKMESFLRPQDRR